MAREVRSNGDTIRAKEFALDEMKLGFAELTNHLTTGGVDTMVTLSFEKLYRNVYRAITHGLGNDWFEIVRSAAQRIVFRFRNNHHRYDTCAEVMRDISMFAEVTFCVANRKRGDYRVRTTFARVWDEWHADKELRSWILWRPVRAVRVKLAILAWDLKTLSLSPYSQCALHSNDRVPCTPVLSCRLRTRCTNSLATW